MTRPLHPHVRWLAFAAVIFGSIGTCLLCGWWSSSRAGAAADDGWRRTEHGWERIAGWQTRASAASSVPVYPAPPAIKPTSRWDTHPAVLALAQLAIVFFALLRLPATLQPSQASSRPPLVHRIRKSFRASAFG